MSNVTPAKAKYYEYNTHLADGTKVSTSSRAAGVNKMTDEEASAVKLEDYFEGWTPAYYTSGDVKPEPVAADYTAVDEAIKAAEALNKDDYEDFSAVTKAIEAVDRTLTSEDQAKVDAMAKAITDAINGLVKKQPVVEPDDPGKTDIKVDLDGNEDAADFKDVASVGDVKVKDEEGKDLTVSEIKLNVEKAAASISEKIDAAIADKNIKGFDSKNADYYDISLKTTDGKVVKLSNGKIKITMSYKKGINAADYNLYVFHMNNNGVLESVAVTADENGFSFEAESFSPYAVVYAAKDSGSDITPSTPENPGNDETPGTTETPDSTVTPDSSVSTGDSLGMFMYMIILAAALAGMAGVVVYDRKRAK